MSRASLALLLTGLWTFVSAQGEPAHPDFVHDIQPLLSRFGCNMSSCHGKAEGQNGFALSVFGHHPEGDYEALTLAGRGRRLMFSAPERSLLLRKATAELPHEGGQRLKPGSPAYQRLHRWIANGALWSNPERPELTRLEIQPSQEVLGFKARQALKVIAFFTDGSQEDVTWLSVFHSNQVGMAEVTPDGEVTTGTTTGQTAIMARYLDQVAVFQAIIPRPGDPDQAGSAPFSRPPALNAIDHLVDANLDQLNLRASPLSSDADFLRRAYLDLAGRIPSAVQAGEFLSSQSPVKRSELVEQLLDSPDYADHWALKWADLLRVDREQLSKRDALAYYRWIRDAILTNQPVDQFARDILLAEGPLSENPAGHLYQVSKRAGDTAATVSQVFLGIRITCAECHQHPYDRWTQQDYHGMRAFFESVSTKPFGKDRLALIARGSQTATHPRTEQVVHPHPLGTTMPEAFDYGRSDRREGLAHWLTDAANPWFAKNMANRVWAHLMGRGLVEPVDDFRATNPPTNPELLDLLAAHLVAHRYDVKSLIRFIMASRTYQLSSQPLAENEMDESNFARALFRRLPAEVLLDAICDITGIPEKFPGFPEGHRAVQLWDSQSHHYFLKLFGRPTRTTPCSCERATGASMGQALHLMNSPNLQHKLSHRDGRIAKLVAQHLDNRSLIDTLYLTAYARFPTTEERAAALDYFDQQAPHRQDAAEDLVWSMLNTSEFIFNH